MRINPLIIFNLFLLLLLTIDLFVGIFLYQTGHHRGLTYIFLGLIFVILCFFLYALTRGISVSEKTLTDIDNRKNRIRYDRDGFTIDSPLIQVSETVPWTSVEAVFLTVRPPLEGEYHFFEYIVILNTPPTLKMHEGLKWYNRLSMRLPDRKLKGLPFVRIKDDNNKDFRLFADAVSDNLGGADRHTRNLLTDDARRAVRSSRQHCIYDRGSRTDDQRLMTYRTNTSD